MEIWYEDFPLDDIKKLTKPVKHSAIYMLKIRKGRRYFNAYLYFSQVFEDESKFSLRTVKIALKTTNLEGSTIDMYFTPINEEQWIEQELPGYFDIANPLQW